MTGLNEILIKSDAAWNEFYADNEDALNEQVGDEETCRRLALTTNLMIGGGAAPLFRVGFATHLVEVV